MPVATAREVLGHVEDDSLGRTIRLGAALWALPQGPGAGRGGSERRARRPPGGGRTAARPLGWCERPRG